MRLRNAAVLGWCVVLAAGLSAGAASAEVVRLKNGNTVEGDIVSEDGGQVVVNVPGVGEIAFSSDEVAAVEGGGSDAAAYRLLLVNGDELMGRVSYEDGQRVELQVPDMGLVTLKREEIAMMEPMRESDLPSYRAESESRAADGRAPAAGRGQAQEVDDMERIRQAAEQYRGNAQAQAESAKDLVARIYGQGSAGGQAGQGSIAFFGRTVTPEQMEAFGRSAGGWILGLIVIGYIYAASCLQRLANRTGTDGGWMAWLPVFNLYLLCKTGGRPGWWVFLYVIPFVNLLVDVAVWMGVASARGKPSWIGLFALIPLGNMVLLGYLAFSGDPTPASV